MNDSCKTKRERAYQSAGAKIANNQRRG